MLRLTSEFKSISLLIDESDNVWLHDADSKSLIVFDANLKEVKRFSGQLITLCSLPSPDYQDDLVFSEDKNSCLWYQGEGSMLIIDVPSISIRKQVLNFSSTRG